MANLNERELCKAFGVGVHTAIAGGCIASLALIAQFFNLSHIVVVGLWICVAGSSIAIAAVTLQIMNDFFRSPEVIQFERSPKFVAGCSACAYFHGLHEIHCAVHPHGKNFEDCKDYEINTSRILH